MMNTKSYDAAKESQNLICKETPEERLINAIIARAADDYRMGYRIINSVKKFIRNKRGEMVLTKEWIAGHALIIDAIHFFRSDLYKGWTDVDGEYILARLEREVKEKYKEKYEKVS